MKNIQIRGTLFWNLPVLFAKNGYESTKSHDLLFEVGGQLTKMNVNGCRNLPNSV